MRIQSVSPSAVYSTTTFMRRIDARLTLASSITLAVLLFIVVSVSSAPPSSAPGAEPAVGGLMIGTQTISTDELARRVKAGEIRSIKVIGSHAVATTTDGEPFTSPLLARRAFRSNCRAWVIRRTSLARSITAQASHRWMAHLGCWSS